MSTIPCELCGAPTHMTSTKRCDRCWELERRVLADPQLAGQILVKRHQNQYKLPKWSDYKHDDYKAKFEHLQQRYARLLLHALDVRNAYYANTGQEPSRSVLHRHIDAMYQFVTKDE